MFSNIVVDLIYVGEHSIIDGDCDRFVHFEHFSGKVGEHSIIDGDCDEGYRSLSLIGHCRRAFHN